MFYCITISYLFLAIIYIGFPSVDKGEIIRGIFSVITTIASLLVAFFTYKAANKSASAAENAASAAQESSFYATFEKRFKIYNTMWELNSILEEVDRTNGCNLKNPKSNYVTKELIVRLIELHEVLVVDSMILPEPIHGEISRFYISVRDHIRSQGELDNLPETLSPEDDKELIDKIKFFKDKNHEMNIEVSRILNDLKQYIKVP